VLFHSHKFAYYDINAQIKIHVANVVFHDKNIKRKIWFVSKNVFTHWAKDYIIENCCDLNFLVFENIFSWMWLTGDEQ
jgi:hypothetical protein